MKTILFPITLLIALLCTSFIPDTTTRVAKIPSDERLQVIPTGKIEFTYTISDTLGYFNGWVKNMDSVPLHLFGTNCNGADFYIAKNVTKIVLIDGDNLRFCASYYNKVITLAPAEKYHLESKKLYGIKNNEALAIQLICVNRAIEGEGLRTNPKLAPKNRERKFDPTKLVWGKQIPISKEKR